jgi:hypothetical protein
VPARKKTLADFVADRSFLARRHANLLDEDGLVGDGELRALQEAYQRERDGLERQKLARRFQHTVRQGSSRPPFPLAAAVYSLGPPDATDSAGEALERRFAWWLPRYGALWRWKHGVAGHNDFVVLYRRLSGDRRNRRSDVAREWLDAHGEEVDELIASSEPIPPPPTSRPS